MKESQDTLKIENLDHLGIVAGIIDEIGLDAYFSSRNEKRSYRWEFNGSARRV